MTIREALNQLPDGYRERALRNYELFPLRSSSINIDRIATALVWDLTPEKEPFWSAVCSALDNPMPALPKEEL